MRHRVFGSLLFIIGILVLLTPKYILPVCEYTGRQRMACSYTGWAEMFMGGIIMAAGFASFFSRTSDALKWLMFLSLTLAVSVIFIPSALGYCHSPQMPCNYGSVPMLRLLGIFLAIISASGFVISARRLKTS